jgi:hypothetical protein
VRIEPGTVAFDKAVALQPLQPLADRGRRQPDPLGQLDIGDTAIPLKNERILRSILSISTIYPAIQIFPQIF